MNKKLLIAVLILLLIVAGLGFYAFYPQQQKEQQKSIKILFPQHNVTYGPWSETYTFYPKTKSNAHQMRVKLTADQQNVVYYRLYNNGKPIVYAGNMQLEDFNANDNVFDFPADDLEPVTLVGPVTTLNNITAIAYDKDKNEIDRDSVVFFLAINIEDYFEVLDREDTQEVGFAIRPEDLARINVQQETVVESKDLFDVKQEFWYVKVKDKFTQNEKEHTAVRTTIIPKIPGVNISLYTIIPKEIVESVNNLVLQQNFTVMDPDPVMLWQFANVDKAKTLEYHVEEKLRKEQIAEIKVISVPTKQDLKKPLFYFLIPVLLIPMIMFTIIYFSKYAKHEE